MQSRDDIGNLVHTEVLDNFQKVSLQEQIKALSNSLEKASSKGGVSHVVAPIPPVGSIVKIDGLTYVVRRSLPGRGRIVLDIEQPKE